MSTKNQIHCPNCGHSIPVEEALNQQAEIRIRKEMEQKVAQQNAILHQRQNQLDDALKQFEEAKKKENQLFQTRLEQKLKEEKIKLTSELQGELVEKIHSLETDLEKRKRKPGIKKIRNSITPERKGHCRSC